MDVSSSKGFLPKQFCKPDDLTRSEEEALKEMPLTKSLGFAIRKSFGKEEQNSRLNQEYRYNEQKLETSTESNENVDTRLVRKLRKVGDEVHRPLNEVSARRARSQELRRRKLSSQGLRSQNKYSTKYDTDFETY